MLNKNKHPFYDHSEADFFIARQKGKIVGRIAALENKPYNQYHHSGQAAFYLFDSINDQEVANALFNSVADWAHKRGLNHIVGPKGFNGLDGYGILVEGFEHRQMMNMMTYNYSYYPTLFEQAGFQKENDFVSCYIKTDDFRLPEKVHEISKRIKDRRSLWVKKFKNKRELIACVPALGEAYNSIFVNNWEYYPFTSKEVKFMLDSVINVAICDYIKFIMHDDQIIGFMLAFPDVSAAMQRHGGKINLISIIDLLIEMKRTKWVAINGAGVLPEFHGRGANALLYTEMENTLRSAGFIHAEQTQMADTAVQVRKDMETLGARIYKRHRVFGKDI
jgi:hypothetical protein